MPGPPVNADPATTILYVGIDWTEQRRTPAIEHGWKPWTVRFPMCDPPHLTKSDILGWARAEGIRPPRAYADGFVHNNCSLPSKVLGAQVRCLGGHD
ncbi:hypothetical protein ABZS66_28030 [Dactylosporangium sp. NPDC005572]|uniref:hypothetical protein n=1 Tax=Dactylosporangium sp. NPDC005572 TaxID=3156889 RepID=UPI0033AF46F6